MATIMTLDAKEVASNITITVRIRRMGQFYLRTVIGSFFLKLATRILWTQVETVDVDALQAKHDIAVRGLRDIESMANRRVDEGAYQRILDIRAAADVTLMKVGE